MLGSVYFRIYHQHVYKYICDDAGVKTAAGKDFCPGCDL